VLRGSRSVFFLSRIVKHENIVAISVSYNLGVSTTPSENFSQPSDHPPTPGPPRISFGWTFFSNHSHVLICLARDPAARLRDVAERVGITERAVQRIVRELVDAGALSRRREGRRNTYRVNREHRLHHPLEGHCTVGDVLDMVIERGGHGSE